MKTQNQPARDLGLAPKLVSIEKAADILQKSAHSTRQLALRGMIESEKVNSRTFLKLDSVLTYYARKKNLPCWEDTPDDVKKQTFVSLEFASEQLMVQPPYLVRLLRIKGPAGLEGYVTACGDIMITRSSINSYLRRADAPRTKARRKAENSEF